MPVDGTYFSSTEIMNNRRLLNEVVSKSVPVGSLLDLLCTAIVYARTFEECYTVFFLDARLKDVRRDMV